MEEGKISQLKELFVKQSTFEEHYIAQRDEIKNYLATLTALIELGMEIKDSSKARCLAALWSHRQYKIANFLLSEKKQTFGLTEVLKAVNLLDSGRKIRVLEKRLNLLKKQSNVKLKTIGNVTSSINDLKREPVKGSLSGALIKHIKTWVKTISKEELEFYTIQFPKEPWKELSDLLHLNPTKDFTEDWFLKVAYGEKAPETSLAFQCENLSQSNALEIIMTYSIPYSFLRKEQKYKQLLNPQIISHVAKYTPVETLLWFYEELKEIAGSGNIPEENLDFVIEEKLASRTGPLNMGYGKLMERLLKFRKLKVPFYQQLIPVAEEKLKLLKIPLEPPVICIGDASSSMQIAVETSTIISSLLSAITNAEYLRFFNTTTIIPPKNPQTIQDVIDLTDIIKAEKMTSPAAALREFYDNKISAKTFFMITDQEENTPSKGDNFARLFQKYRNDVQKDAQIVFVSFLKSQNTVGQMVTDLNALNIQPFAEMKLDPARPDLSKLDSLLVLLSTQSTAFTLIVNNQHPTLSHLFE